MNTHQVQRGSASSLPIVQLAATRQGAPLRAVAHASHTIATPTVDPATTHLGFGACEEGRTSRLTRYPRVVIFTLWELGP
jgi:hypothetical protein